MGRHDTETRTIDRWANEMGVMIEKNEDTGEWQWSDGEGRSFFGFGSFDAVLAGVHECYPDGLEEEDEPYDHDDELIDGVGFADPGGRSALRAETKDNPRNLPCPNCGEPNRLTPADKARGYQCDACADLAERGGY